MLNKNFGQRFFFSVMTLLAALLVIAAVSAVLRLSLVHELWLASVVVALVAAWIFVARREYVRGYKAHQRGVYFQSDWSRAKRMGWADSYMEDAGNERAVRG
jgi:nitrate/nitrite transporter NarK